jgi:hypothetical protein
VKKTHEKNSKENTSKTRFQIKTNKKLQVDFRDYVFTFRYQTLFSYIGSTDVFEKPVSSETLVAN